MLVLLCELFINAQAWITLKTCCDNSDDDGSSNDDNVWSFINSVFVIVVLLLV